MNKVHEISANRLSIDDIELIINQNKKLVLSQSSRDVIQKSRDYLDQKMQESSLPIYGINTGFGSLYNVSIDKKDLGNLQKNLIISHACGMGEEIQMEIVQLILLLKIQSLSYGISGISLEVIERLIAMYNEGVYPVIYSQGSLGASGDLAPLAHLSLPLLGIGEVMYQGKRVSSESVNKTLGWNPIELKSKEGLALLNGTQFILGHAVYIAIHAKKVRQRANEVAALSLDAYDGKLDPFDALIGQIRPHKGQVQTARDIRSLLEGSALISQPKKHVQDPYSFRCIPQVHGASSDSLDHFIEVMEVEINSVTDNPNIFVEEDRIISAGNFHAQALALPLDYLSIALAEWGNISERRIYLLLSGQRDLPLYLVAKPGLNSGFMIAQYTAASIVSQSKQYATPASIDSIVSSNGQEDHVSMGANAATKCLKILNNTKSILGIEAMTACQAIEFKNPKKTSPKNLDLFQKIRLKVPFVENDLYMSPWLRESVSILFY